MMRRRASRGDRSFFRRSFAWSKAVNLPSVSFRGGVRF